MIRVEALLSPMALYKQALVSKPLLTNMVTAGSLSVLSDSFTQKAENAGKDSQSFDSYRSSTMFVYGMFVSGWFVSKWFAILNRWIPTGASSPLPRVLAKVAVNQICMSPILNSMFFIWIGITRGGFSTTFHQKAGLIREKITNDLVPTMARSCGFWGVFNIANFSVVPPRYQLLFTNLGFVLWFAYLSFVGYRDKLNAE